MELSAAEARVLGCLIEKATLDPDAYPVSLNELRLACNQSWGRDPVVAYDDRQVEDTLLSLKSKGLARFVGPLRSEGTVRYSHRVDHRWRLGPAELAVLSVLLVGGPLTLVDIDTRARRLHDFGDRGEIAAVLDTLAARTPMPFAARLDDPAIGEMRWVQSLTGAPMSSGSEPGAPGGVGTKAQLLVSEPSRPTPSYAALAARVAQLERRLAAVTERPAVLGANDWSSRRAVPVGEAPDDHTVQDHQGWAAQIGPAGRSRALPPGGDAATLTGLAQRLADIERRLTRIEAELGALR